MNEKASLEEKIEEKLRSALNVKTLSIINESHLHAGHAGDNGTGESHFRVQIEALELDGLPRIAQHRKINSILAEELSGPIHALAIQIGKSL